MIDLSNFSPSRFSGSENVDEINLKDGADSNIDPVIKYHGNNQNRKYIADLENDVFKPLLLKINDRGLCF